jgi:PTS system cellobiose-specific IIC component
MFFAASKSGDLPYTFLGANGLFVAIIIAILSTELFVKLSGNKKLIINMPEGVPPAVSKSFAALLPAVIVLVVFSLVKCLLVTIGVVDLHKVIFDAIQAPLMGMADSFGSAIVIVFLVHLLWFFGLHGTNIMEPIMQTIYMPLLNDNMKAFQAHAPIPHIVTKPFFDAFVYLGGAGTSICLLIAVFIISKRKQMRTIANLGIAPACFNITEPVIFGLPIVLNPVLIVPFIFVPVVLTTITYFAMASGLVPRTIAMLPWTTPPIIGGFLATGSWRGAALAAFNLVVGVALYVPFIVSADRYESKKENEITKEKEIAL